MKRLCLDGLPDFDRQAMTLAHNVATSVKFRNQLQQQHQYEDAVSELYYHIASQCDKYQGRDLGYMVVAMENRLYDFLKVRSAEGATSVPRDVFKTPKKLGEKDTRQHILNYFFLDNECEFFTIEGRDQSFLQLGLYTQDTLAVIRSQYETEVLAELEEHPDFQNIVRAVQETTMRGKAIAMGCKSADVERSMNEAYIRICAYVSERMGRLGD
jgi:hypothetical protein